MRSLHLHYVITQYQTYVFFCKTHINCVLLFPSSFCTIFRIFFYQDIKIISHFVWADTQSTNYILGSKVRTTHRSYSYLLKNVVFTFFHDSETPHYTNVRGSLIPINHQYLHIYHLTVLLICRTVDSYIV